MRTRAPMRKRQSLRLHVQPEGLFFCVMWRGIVCLLCRGIAVYAYAARLIMVIVGINCNPML